MSRARAADAADLLVYGTTDEDEIADLIEAFQALSPGVRVQYRKQLSTDVYGQVVKDVAAGGHTADVVWSSAMDLQMKLVNDGYARTCHLANASHVAKWSVWRDQAFGVTAEPILFAYNTASIKPADVPTSHAALRGFLERNAQALHGRVATYDPAQSGSGFLFIVQDVEITPETWNLVAALGRTDPKLLTMTNSMLDGVSSGQIGFAYNVIGSYAMARRQHDVDLGVVIPSDYVILMSRIAFVPAAARRPETGAAFLDFLLSRQGQALLAARYCGSVRDDVPPVAEFAAIGRQTQAYPIQIGPSLLAYMDQARRTQFLGKWQQAMQTQ